MAKPRSKTEKTIEPNPPRLAPARTLEQRENQLIALSMDETERLIRTGKATSQLLNEFNKRGSTEAQLRKELLKKENELMAAKTELIKAQRSQEELFEKVIQAMKSYNGIGEEEYEN